MIYDKLIMKNSCTFFFKSWGIIPSLFLILTWRYVFIYLREREEGEGERDIDVREKH